MVIEISGGDHFLQKLGNDNLLEGNVHRVRRLVKTASFAEWGEVE
jgi:hypothetical protein